MHLMRHTLTRIIREGLSGRDLWRKTGREAGSSVVGMNELAGLVEVRPIAAYRKEPETWRCNLLLVGRFRLSG